MGCSFGYILVLVRGLAGTTVLITAAARRTDTAAAAAAALILTLFLLVFIFGCTGFVAGIFLVFD
jgi:hypothetical protein